VYKLPITEKTRHSDKMLQTTTNTKSKENRRSKSGYIIASYLQYASAQTDKLLSHLYIALLRLLWIFTQTQLSLSHDEDAHL
jgi:hypothetical protein